jgi:hypothetical protein
MNVRNSTMSLRCSLLGHNYGETEIEREREEQGSEVVVTVREFEECDRCGKRKVLTENKEVTALESPAPDLESAESSELADSAETDADATPNEGDGAEIMTDSVESGQSPDSADPSTASDASATETPAGTSSPGVEDDLDEGQSAADDDGVILDDDETEERGDRRPGEWPEAEEIHPAETDENSYEEWPEVGQEDEGFDAEPGGGDADVEFGGGLTPESAPEVDDEEADEVEFVNAEGDRLAAREPGGSESELSSGISAGAEAPSLSGPADDPDVDAEFVCPECDYREGVAGSSLRAGDICPECARGYLAQE